MRALNQQILPRLRLLVICLFFAIAMEPPAHVVETWTPAQIVMIAGARPVSVPSAAPQTAHAPAALTTEHFSPEVRTPATNDRPRVEPTSDGRHLYLEHCALLC